MGTENVDDLKVWANASLRVTEADGRVSVRRLHVLGDTMETCWRVARLSCDEGEEVVKVDKMGTFSEYTETVAPGSAAAMALSVVNIEE